MANEQHARPHKRKKVCAFCVEKATAIDYKDTARLRKFISERAKILPRNRRIHFYNLFSQVCYNMYTDKNRKEEAFMSVITILKMFSKYAGSAATIAGAAAIIVEFVQNQVKKSEE